MYPLHSQPTMDRISSLPDSILCYILSFLPTKQAVATSVLSKRWKPIWFLVPSLDFNFKDFNFDRVYFHDSVHSFLFSCDSDQALGRLRIECFPPKHLKRWRDPPISIQTLFEAVTRGRCRLEHLYFNLDYQLIVPSVFSCKTLVVLKLVKVMVHNISFADLPSLKILGLYSVCFVNDQDCPHLFSSCPNLEDLTMTVRTAKFNRLPKLIRANINVQLVSLEIVRNVEVLLVDWVMTIKLLWYLFSFFFFKKTKRFLDVIILSYYFVFFADIWRPDLWLSEFSSIWIEKFAYYLRIWNYWIIVPNFKLLWLIFARFNCLRFLSFNFIVIFSSNIIINLILLLLLSALFSFMWRSIEEAWLGEE